MSTIAIGDWILNTRVLKKIKDEYNLDDLGAIGFALDVTTAIVEHQEDQQQTIIARSQMRRQAQLVREGIALKKVENG